MSINLKRAIKSDIPALISTEKSAAGTKTYSPILEEKEWGEALEKEVVYLIEKDGVVIGNISYERKEENKVYISGLVIIPPFQGQGIGREVIIRILDEVKDAKRVELVTHPDNAPALALYKSLGFVVEKRIENYYGDGEPRLVLVFERK